MTDTHQPPLSITNMPPDVMVNQILTYLQVLRDHNDISSLESTNVSALRASAIDVLMPIYNQHAGKPS